MMTDLILPPVSWPRLPPAASTAIGEPVTGSVLHALGRAGQFLLGIKGRHVIHRGMAPWNIGDISEMAAEEIRLWWACRFHCRHVAVLVRYQGLGEGKDARTLDVALYKKTLGGAFDAAAADIVSFEVARGTLGLCQEYRDLSAASPRPFWPVLEAFTGLVPQDGAGRYVPRPLTMPDGEAPREMGLKVITSEGIRVVSVDVWELAEEAIEQ